LDSLTGVESLAGKECLFFVRGMTIESAVFRINGVRPEELESAGDGIGGPGSENRTRFFALLGVVGGVEKP
jgi:hypothetical protein